MNFSFRVASIGNLMYGTITGYKFEDLVGPGGTYPNGIMDQDEYGIGNWEIKLDGRQVNGVHISVTTYTANIGPPGGIGLYGFMNLLPGTYWVNETLMANWVPTTTCVAKLVLPAYPLWSVHLIQNFGNMHPADPEMNFVLKPGMNLWSSPLQLAVPLRASQLSAAIGSSCLMISRWNGTTQAWDSYITGFTPTNSYKDFRLKNGEGYYIVSRVATAFQLEGDLVTGAQINLVTGINLIGYDSLRPMLASQFVSLGTMQNGGKILAVSLLDDSGQWQSYITGFTPAGSYKDFTMSQSHAYLIYASAPGTLTFPAA